MGKFTAWGSYIIPMNRGAQLELFGVHSWTDEVFYSPFGTQEEKADFFFDSMLIRDSPIPTA